MVNQSEIQMLDLIETRIIRKPFIHNLDHPDNLKNKKAIVRIAFPIKNFDLEQDGITQLICTFMGGQMDIEEILGVGF